MRQCFRVSGAAVSRCAIRRLRLVGAARDALVDAPRLRFESAGCAAPFALATCARQQSTAPDKRFHCNVCKKAFRLEMAAKLHLQQVHGGEGAVEAGAGPGVPEEHATPTPVGVLRNAPPQAPTVVTPVQVEAHDRSSRREKPAPRPLHQAEREVPSLVMEKMLSVWDDIGVKRIGGQFVHSSMVMRVFAARPSDSAEPLYEAVNPEGENPFDAGGGGGASPDGPLHSPDVEGGNIYSLSMTDAFALATAEAFGPCRPAKCPNPFLLKTAREVGKPAARAEVAEALTAPVTPFGQLPMFGVLPVQSAPPPGPPPTPEAPATDAADADSGTLVPSPFASGVDASPFAGTATTPFADAGYSPFALDEPTPAAADSTTTVAPDASNAEVAVPAIPSPFASPFTNTAASPFVSAASPFAASPFTTNEAAVPHAGGYTGAEASYVPAAAAPAAAEVPPAHVCSMCEKSFSTHEGLRMHSKAKHGLELPREAAPAKRQSVPDLPAYIPSPVDLAMTSPFGSAEQHVTWSEVELTPYAQSMSNITVAGKVLDADVLEGGNVLLAVFVRGTTATDDETIAVRCSAEAMRAIGSPFVRGDLVFACGSLRLLPAEEENGKKVFASPVVYVTSPTGVIAKLNTYY